MTGQSAAPVAVLPALRRSARRRWSGLRSPCLTRNRWVLRETSKIFKDLTKLTLMIPKIQRFYQKISNESNDHGYSDRKDHWNTLLIWINKMSFSRIAHCPQLDTKNKLGTHQVTVSAVGDAIPLHSIIQYTVYIYNVCVEYNIYIAVPWPLGKVPWPLFPGLVAVLNHLKKYLANKTNIVEDFIPDVTLINWRYLTYHDIIYKAYVNM